MSSLKIVAELRKENAELKHTLDEIRLNLEMFYNYTPHKSALNVVRDIRDIVRKKANMDIKEQNRCIKEL